MLRLYEVSTLIPEPYRSRLVEASTNGRIAAHKINMIRTEAAHYHPELFVSAAEEAERGRLYDSQNP